MTPMQFRECLAHLTCMSKNEFIQVFGSEHYWDKFHNVYKKDVARFVCYLDLGNLRVLMNYLNNHLYITGVK